MEFFELAHRQRAYRFLEPDPVPEELIEQILDVATKAPSAQNTQPWEFIVVQDPAVRGRLADHTRHLWESFARDYSRPTSTPTSGRTPTSGPAALSPGRRSSSSCAATPGRWTPPCSAARSSRRCRTSSWLPSPSVSVR